MNGNHTARVYLRFQAERSPWDEARIYSLKPVGMSRRRPKEKVGEVIVSIDVAIPDTAFVGYTTEVTL